MLLCNFFRFHEKMELERSGAGEKSDFDIWADWEKVRIRTRTNYFLPIYQYNYNQLAPTSNSSESLSSTSLANIFLRGDKVFAYNNLVRNLEQTSHESIPEEEEEEEKKEMEKCISKSSD